MTPLTLREIHEQVEEDGTVDALVAQLAPMLDCPTAEVRAYLNTLQAVALRGLEHHPDVMIAAIAVGFANGYRIGEKDGASVV
jgi:hypothetical protein